MKCWQRCKEVGVLFVGKVMKTAAVSLCLSGTVPELLHHSGVEEGCCTEYQWMSHGGHWSCVWSSLRFCQRLSPPDISLLAPHLMLSLLLLLRLCKSQGRKYSAHWLFLPEVLVHLVPISTTVQWILKSNCCNLLPLFQWEHGLPHSNICSIWGWNTRSPSTRFVKS